MLKRKPAHQRRADDWLFSLHNVRGYSVTELCLIMNCAELYYCERSDLYAFEFTRSVTDCAENLTNANLVSVFDAR